MKWYKYEGVHCQHDLVYLYLMLIIWWKDYTASLYPSVFFTPSRIINFTLTEFVAVDDVDLSLL